MVLNKDCILQPNYWGHDVVPKVIKEQLARLENTLTGTKFQMGSALEIFLRDKLASH